MLESELFLVTFCATSKLAGCTRIGKAFPDQTSQRASDAKLSEDTPAPHSRIRVFFVLHVRNVRMQKKVRLHVSVDPEMHLFKLHA